MRSGPSTGDARAAAAGAFAAAALAALALFPVARAAAAETRVFAVEPKLDIAWMESRQAYHDKAFALFDGSQRGPGAPLIQQGAGDVASSLRPDGRNFVAWPEDMGLFAALTGPRAAPARASGSLEGAILTLTTLYGDENAYYTSRFPELANRELPVRTTLVSLTDTFGRVALETFAEMADRYDVWLETGVNMVQRWQVVCRDQTVQAPLGESCDEVNAGKVQQLGDPFEPQRGYVYEALTPKVSNMALVFAPDGRLHAKELKTYITPTELPGQLDLVPGEVSGGLGAVDTPVGRFGFVTSKDAWMPDVVQKLDQRGVDVLVQPEFFVNDLVDPEGMWAPDTLLASGYNDLVRHPSFETLVLPELVGNIFNFSADHQSHIAIEPRRGVGSGALVGQPPSRGLVDVLGWVVEDPAAPGEPFLERRRRLGEAGQRLKPGSGVQCPDPAQPGPCENGHVEGVLFRDVEVGREPAYRRYRGRRARTPFSRSRPVARSRNPQRNATLSLHGRRGVAAWEEERSGDDTIMIARTRSAGRSWTRAKPMRGGVDAGDEWWPSVAVGPRGRVTLAWVDRRVAGERSNGFAEAETGDVFYLRSTNGGRSFPGPAERLVPPSARANGWMPALAQGRGDVVHAAWIEERERSADDDLPQAHVYYTRIERGEAGQPVRLDTGEPDPLAAKLDHSWAPSVSAKGDRVLVTWVDFLNYDWDVFARSSSDGGRTFGGQQPVNDTPDVDEALNDSPEAVLGRNPWVAWTDWRKRDSSAMRPHQQYDINIARPGDANRQADPYGTRPASTFSPSACSYRRDNLLVAFQDASRGQNDIRIARMPSGRRRGRALRVDDGGPAAGNAWRPELGCSKARVVALWEDERDGPSQVYFAAARPRELR